jgi:hypothetical protein
MALSVMWIGAIVTSAVYFDTIKFKDVLRAATVAEKEECVRLRAKTPGAWCEDPRPSGAHVPFLTNEGLRYGIAALGVPVVVLSLGFLLGFVSRWVGRGFR